jgi:methylated-DNA-[protein]-cysteine S-methyltransferase
MLLRLMLTTMMTMAKFLTSTTITSPLGPIHLAATQKGLICCTFISKFEDAAEKKKKRSYNKKNKEAPAPPALGEERPQGDGSKRAHAIVQQAQIELKEYFDGTRHEFKVPVSTSSGTVFQQSVWKALQEIPYGTTCSYSDIATAIASPKAARAVGMANNKNPISLIIPCHRVIGKDGSLVGYGSGLDRKQVLLDMEEQQKENPTT